jgi:uncharacterized membrane protein
MEVHVMKLRALRAAFKAMTWRVVGAIDTFALAWLVTGSAGGAGVIMGFEVFTKTALYIGHELAWAWATEEDK